MSFYIDFEAHLIRNHANSIWCRKDSLLDSFALAKRINSKDKKKVIVKEGLESYHQ